MSLPRFHYRLLYRFLWKKGPDKIKRLVIDTNIVAGDIKMVNVRAFMNSLKLSWIKRLLNKNGESLVTLSRLNITKVVKLGPGYASVISEEHSNISGNKC
jgi:hypothetical protein